MLTENRAGSRLGCAGELDDEITAQSSGLASPHFFLPEPDEHGLVPVHNDQRVGPLPYRRLTGLCNLHIFPHAVRIRP